MNCDLLEIEHPQLLALYEHWVRQCEDGKLPSRTHFNAVDLTSWLGHIMIIQPIDYAQDFLYKLHGTALVEIVGEDLTGQYLSSFKENDRRIHVAKQYRDVCQSGCPSYKSSDKPFEKNYKTIKKLILPIASDGKSVDTLIVGVYGEVNWLTRGTEGISHSFSRSVQ